MPESRRFPRIDVYLDAHLIVDGEAFRAKIKDLSRGGACVISPHFFPSATDVTVSLEALSRKLGLLGKTVYSFECEPGIFRTGIRFHPLTEANRAVVEALMLQAKSI
ncbi:MAG TPA: PilZ domain-containing protein [Noviherbaspirillum sp.]|uniref:PilZ domain-containing protein n=1 Tax=Noviherbaspirillum sp. TaxID=1926288 RepID=UPI002D3642BF|nr:PilZ domain-containing protein [Noviherbaspirillum sp.]HYD97230.1 PilZ domain-containing protein [Noviherbaspirillum sp.]